ncbi:MAG: NUDIX domain-containing protein [Acidimicrobiia bacterium]|nr:NUDIX domain-containing protein [Acidimicrobiia bacterium]MBT8194273.1 NUDIX domain-containing protein [Acidimicrobiia bacterium]NNJ47125.1 NUDIX domain-containing protein [Acidimicrobiia bacterium]NNL12209.1 NUDIX domain-containing protein [Acidimicrobiia bacterium]
MTRIDHYNDPNAPEPTRLVPAASAVVTDEDGRVLLAKRTDNELWTIPGGTMKPGETIAETAVRETKEETGIDAEVVSLIGIYSNPQHVVEYSDGEVRQQFSVCFVCHNVGGELATSDETSEVGYFSPEEIEVMEIHPSIRLRIQHFLEQRSEPYLG